LKICFNILFTISKNSFLVISASATHPSARLFATMLVRNVSVQLFIQATSLLR